MNQAWHRIVNRVTIAAVALTLVMSLVPQVVVSQEPPPEERERRRGEMPRPPTPEPSPTRTWQVRASPQANLWFHSLAVIAADQPGPLGLYSAEYARHVREVKQERGVYPTPLDSIASDLRTAIGDGRTLESLHFVPLYFPEATPERMFGALLAVAKRRTNDSALAGRDVRFGVAVMAQAFEDGKARRLLERLAGVVEREWTLFYRQYWEDSRAREDSIAVAMQEIWDRDFAPGLRPLLERRRLTGGIVMPSPALGPEGRIVDVRELDPGDQVVAVQEPLLATGPDAAVFAFLKELCFLLVDDRKLNPDSLTVDERENLRRTAAVRCGALLLEFYAPAQVGRYRRAFLDAVGAEESTTVAAFERVYFLDPALYRRLRDQIRSR